MSSCWTQGMPSFFQQRSHAWQPAIFMPLTRRTSVSCPFSRAGGGERLREDLAVALWARAPHQYQDVLFHATFLPSGQNAVNDAAFVRILVLMPRVGATTISLKL